jgi:hypothetical protein
MEFDLQPLAPRNRFLKSVVLAAGLALVWPRLAHADFLWMDATWTVNKFDVTAGPGTTAQPTFGAITADVANAGGTLAANSDPNTVNSGGFVRVAFMRRFRLFNDPDDSDVTLFGTLSGSLNSTSAAPGISASTNVVGNAELRDVPGGELHNFLTSVKGTLALDDTANEVVMEPSENSRILPDGIYSLSGTFEIDVKVDQAQVGIADASADLNWVVGITAQRIVPEPPAFFQLTAGTSVLLGWRRMRRRKVSA